MTVNAFGLPEPGDTLTPGLRCPFCNAEHEVATSTQSVEARPDKGSVSICWKCAEVSFFDDDPRDARRLTLRKPTLEEAVMLSQHPEVTVAQRAIRTRLADPVTTARLLREHPEAAP